MKDFAYATEHTCDDPYSFEEACHEFACGADVDLDDPFALIALVEDCAADYHEHHGGWEDTWPLRISLFAGDGEHLGIWEVDRESCPVFSASKARDTGRGWPR